MPITATPPPDEAAKQAERQALKQDMIKISAEINQSLAADLSNFSVSFETAETKARALEAQLNSPVTSPVLSPEECRIGNWLGISGVVNGITAEEMAEIQREHGAGSRKDKLPENQSVLLKGINQTDEITRPEALAFYSPEWDEITLQTFPASSEETPLRGNEYTCGNPLAKLSVALHEAVHKRHANHNGMYNLEQTPVNAAKIDRLTETTANAVEYLAVANMYTNLKKQRVRNFQYTTTQNGIETNKTMPLDNILDMYPGLKETLAGKEFSPDDKKSVRNIVATASSQWRMACQDHYMQQHRQMVSDVLDAQYDVVFSSKVKNIEKQSQQDKDYQKLSDDMLKNVYIGANTVVDLTGCKDLLDTMNTQDAQDMVKSAQILQNRPRPSDKEILTVNDWLEKKGITKDEDKDKYLEQAFKNIINRSPEADMELKNLLLGSNGSVKYTDGLVEAKVPNSSIRTIAQGNGKTYVIGSFINLSPDKNQEQIHSKSNNSATISPQQLSPYLKNSGR